MKFTRLPLLFASALVLAGAWATPGHAASLFDPALRFRVLRTEHFVIHFHQGGEALARRLAPIVEETWRALASPADFRPPPLTRLVIADQTEFANGYATPLPRNTIVLYTAWPAGSESIGDVTDWLRVAFAHEFTHIVHLDRSDGWSRAVRNVFGRTLIAFPNLLLPQWQIEGLAVFEESTIAGSGRLHAGDFRAIVGEAARTRALEPLDRVNGGLTDWPGGGAAYVYGLGFHDYLAGRFGADSFARLSAATARRAPYAGSGAFKNVYGESLGSLWRAYQAAESAAASSAVDDAVVTRLTHDGFAAVGPRFDRFVCGGCPAEIAYVSSTPHDFPSMNKIAIGGTAERVTRRYYGSTTAFGRTTVYFDQLENRRNTGVYGDLYAMDRATGRVRELTSEARLTEPDLSPDERWIAAVQDRVGARALVRVATSALNGGRPSVGTLSDEPETQFNAPRWAPDGRSIAVERHRLGGRSEIVVVDVESGNVRVVAAMADARIVTPAWTPDGRSIVAAVAPVDQVFNLFEFDVVTRAARQLTHTRGGATWPDVSPDGETIAFVGYTTDGHDVFTMTYPAPSPATIAPLPLPTAASRVPDGARSTAPAGTYSPLPTMLPTSWFPIIEYDNDQLRLGAETQAVDVLGYHAYTASATWLASAPDGAIPPNRAVPDWSAAYFYDRWRPTLFLAASIGTDFLTARNAANGTTAAVTRREGQVEGGVLLPFRHARVTHTALASILRSDDEFTPEEIVTSRSNVHGRLAWSTITARSYGYSISAEDGVAIGATLDLVDGADAAIVTADARAYLPGFARNHVAAFRAAYGASTGDAAAGRLFLLGGADAAGTVIDFSSDAIGLLRGFSSNAFYGRNVALLNADYRFPIARPQRGAGTWPLFLHTIHAAVFADAGHAWMDSFSAGDIKTSIGAELSCDAIAGFYFPLGMTGGVAWGHDGSGTLKDGARFYVRIGRAF